MPIPMLRKSPRRFGSYALLVVPSLCLLLAGCQTAPPPPVADSLPYQLPVLAPVEPEKQDQAKDGLRVSVAGYSYQPKLVYQRQYRKVPQLLTVGGSYPVEVREMPSVEVTPKEVRFKVKIYNNLEHVLRLAGTVVSFQAGGKTLAVPKDRYDDFLNGIILPRQEGEYELSGPDISALPGNATIAFFLYDIITETDAAGNPTRRSNFEFYYALTHEARTQEASVVTRSVGLNAAAASLLPSGEWVNSPQLDALFNSAGSRRAVQ